MRTLTTWELYAVGDALRAKSRLFRGERDNELDDGNVADPAACAKECDDLADIFLAEHGARIDAEAPPYPPGAACGFLGGIKNGDGGVTSLAHKDFPGWTYNAFILAGWNRDRLAAAGYVEATP